MQVSGIQLVSEAIHGLCTQHNRNERFPLPEIVSSGVRATKTAELLSCDNIDTLPSELMLLLHRILHMFWCRLEKYNATRGADPGTLTYFSYLHHCTVFLTNLCRRHLNEVHQGGHGVQDMELVSSCLAMFLPNTTTRRWWLSRFGAAALEVRTEEFIEALRQDYADVVTDVLQLRISNLLTRMVSGEHSSEVVHSLDLGLLCAGNLNVVEQLEALLVTGGENARATPRDAVPCTQCTQREYHLGSLEREILVARKEVDFLRAKGDHVLVEQLAADRDILKKQNEEMRVAMNALEAHLAEVQCVVQVLSGETSEHHESRKARLRTQLDRLVQEDTYSEMLDMLVRRANRDPHQQQPSSPPPHRAQSMPQPETKHVHVTLAGRPKGCHVCPSSATVYTSPVRYFTRKTSMSPGRSATRSWKPPSNTHPR